jgi:hypothetical protein
MTAHLPLIATLAVLTTFQECGPKPAAPPQASHISYPLPVITPVDPSKQDQEKDSIRLSVAPATYGPKTGVHKEYRKVDSIVITDNQYPADMREIPYVFITPNDVRFKVKIYNRLERILRLAGTVVSFQAAGKTISVDKARYDDFLNGIILPRQEGEYEIAGPDLKDVPDNTTIGLFLFDIVTATDGAGNPTQRSNFEFFYTLKREQHDLPTSVITTRVMLSADAAARLAQRGGDGAWVRMPELDSYIPAHTQP